MSSDGSDAVVIGHDDVSDFNPENIIPESPQVIQKIRDWLDATSYNLPGGEYRKHLASHVTGTGTWLTSSAKYQEWLNGSEHGLLWLTGIPGCGKSVMAAMLTDEISKAKPGSPVLFFFFRQIVEANHRPEALLRDWLDQVLVYSPPLQKELKEEMMLRRELGMTKMWELLRLAFASLPERVFCIADALDEMGPGHDGFLKELANLGQWRPNKVKVLITSRPVPSVERPLHNISSLSIRLQENMVDVDISTYVQSELATSTIPRDQWQTIADAVPGRANGLFLYAKLAMDAFLAPGADVNTVLSRLPADLGVLYTDLLRKHALASGIDPAIQHLILQSVTHTARPLRLLELAELIRVTFKDGDKPKPMTVAKDLIRAACGPLLEILPDETVSVVHHSFTEYIKGMTYSDESISRYPILQEGQAHAQLALACLRYMQSGFLDGGDIKTRYSSEDQAYGNEDDEADSDNGLPSSFDREWIRLRLENPFFNYASRNWSWHIRKSEAVGYDQAEINAEVEEFLCNDNRLQALSDLSLTVRVEANAAGVQLHIAAENGLLSFTKAILRGGDVDVNIRAVDHSTPLVKAASQGYSDIVRALLDAGAEMCPDERFSYRASKILSVAAGDNHHEVVKILLESGIDPLSGELEPKENPSAEALHEACSHGHAETVLAFLPFLDESWTHRALHWAASRGRSRVVEVLLQQPGVDVNRKVDDATPLFVACKGRDLSTVTMLLQAGADPKICGNNPGRSRPIYSVTDFEGVYYTHASPVQNGMGSPHKQMNPLHLLCNLASWGDEEFGHSFVQPVLKLFIEAGLDVNELDSEGMTALHFAAQRQGTLTTRLILDAGADANIHDSLGMTPLHYVYTPETVSLLIENGRANIDAMSADGTTPLLRALRSSSNEVILKLLEYGPNCSIVDREGNSALHLVMAGNCSSVEVVRALLDAGADPHRKNHDGLSPLRATRRTKFRSMQLIGILLEAGADVDSLDNQGSTLLFREVRHLCDASSRRGPEPLDSKLIFTRLLESGASIHARDFRGRTLLHEAMVGSSSSSRDQTHNEVTIPSLSFLISLGLDLKAVDYDANGLLHELALRITTDSKQSRHSYGNGAVVLWRWLMDQGLDPEQKNLDGRTPLHILCKANFGRGPQLTPFDFVVSKITNINSSDIYGVCPLHVAATTNERYVVKLLEAGADPTIATHEGLTPLHLAARCRQSNIVGILLDALDRKSGKYDSVIEPRFQLKRERIETPEPFPGVNAEAYGRHSYITPLFYACQSGRPESVALLLAAGAHVRSVLRACLGFVAENRLWEDSRQLGKAGCEFRGEAAALTIDDTSRPKVGAQRWETEPRHETANGSTRMGEILQMLKERGADLSPFQDAHNLSDMIHKGTVYKITGSRDLPACTSRKLKVSDFLEQESLVTRQASKQALKQFKAMQPGQSHESLFSHLLVRRDYDLIEDLSDTERSLLPMPTCNRSSSFHVLVKQGFAQLVETIGTLEAKRSLEKGNAWHAFGHPTQPGLWCSQREYKSSYDHPAFFLRDAVQRELPNLDVVKLLVEKFGVDINETQPTTSYADPFCLALPVDSALHFVAQGTAWWQAYQALPFLLQSGAAVDLRDGNYRTPLHIALHSRLSFSRATASMLLEAGADPDAVDQMGSSCFFHAWHDGEKIKLLLDHGAKVGPDTIEAAIRSRDPALLERLLLGRRELASRGRPSREETPTENQKPPLLMACWQIPQKPGEHIRLEAEVRIVEILIRHGADPLAKFWQRLYRGDRQNNPWDDTYKNITLTPGGDGYREATILHELLLKNHYVDCLFDVPDLNVNHRDSEGRTLIHVACLALWGADHIIPRSALKSASETPVSIFQRLISLDDVDLEACDDSGRNVLHHMFDSGDDRGKPFSRFRNALPEVLRRAPKLINLADKKGKTPLHEAMVYAAKQRDSEIMELLLQHGGNVLDVDADGNSLLHILARKLDSDITRNLFRNLATGSPSVDVNMRNKRGETPLFSFATRMVSEYNNNDSLKNEEEAITMLQDLGADFFVRDNKGRGLLHVAARGDAIRFKQLLDLGLDASIEDDAHQTPIDVAAATGYAEILLLFEKKKK